MNPRDQSPFFDIPDAHAVSVVASHHGLPLEEVKVGAHEIHGITCQVNPEPLDRYKEAVRSLVALL